MNRRRLLSLIFAVPAAVASAPSQAAPSRRVLLQQSPLAGFQYHAGERLWALMQPGDPLQLVREPTNPYDPRAVAVHFQGQRIGYLPRAENTAVAQMLDRGERLAAHIQALALDADPWKRVRVSVELLA
ncbi:HIRAN domain-containing protein [Sinimarinibacterium thermocellulolyticum]|uniref:HIRAN domain-containing protein n=1 Tax=Sinimarinibacterium thermocellulolyticum TaxID=3170016 RepID=A0ABV2A6I4_9GAMM